MMEQPCSAAIVICDFMNQGKMQAADLSQSRIHGE